MKKAFTLIELLVVIAIIAILAAMLMPALERARKTAKTTQCVSNLHNLGIAINMFRNDYGGWVAGADVVRNNYAHTMCQTLHVTMQDYHDDWDALRCPSLEVPGYASRDPYIAAAGISVDFCKLRPEEDFIHGLGPAEITYFFDELRVPPEANPARAIAADGIEMITAYGPEPANHADGSNVLYVDMAVDWNARTEMDVRWERTAGEFGNDGDQWYNYGPDNGPFVMYGFIGNQRLQEDSQGGVNYTGGDRDSIYHKDAQDTEDDENDGFTLPQAKLRGSWLWGGTKDIASTKDAAIAGGAMMAADWWGGNIEQEQFWRGKYNTQISSYDVSGYHGWHWGVPPDMEAAVFEDVQ